MEEKDVRIKLHHALQWRGYWPLHHQDGRIYPCPVCHKGKITTVPEVKGRPDTEARHPKFPTALIEVKAVKGTAFEFEAITPEQRAYLSAWENEGGKSFICLGKIIPYGTKEAIHSIYVIPWHLWTLAEMDLRALLDMKSMPYDYRLYTNNVERRTSDLVTRFSQYRLIYVDKSWHFPSNHPLAVMDEVKTPYFLRSKETKNENHNMPALQHQAQAQ